ncbi:unnamed protein product [Paramecium octaurelia]|uniref:E2 ubiquitin-conjugating enzyme n=1 Tax=Paramecium octaurelia TaxID=43137 RepID=A0A8S1THK5_PAROT|nr:unnamed protein product [Paramecium octaurelia]
MIQDSLVLKLIFKDIKLKFSVPDPTQSIEYLKGIILQKLSEQGISLLPNNVQCNDSDDFMLNSSDIIGQLLKQNDTVKLVEKVADNIIQQQQQQQQQQSQDNATESPQIIQQQDPAEAIVVLYDISGSMSSQFFGDKELSRMGAVNAFFSAFADKTLAFEFNHIVKLVWFGSALYDKCEFISDFNKFIKLVDDANPGGSTKCYDAIDYAINKLLEVKQKYPDIVLRILALTDGEDNASTSKPNTLVQKIFDHKIIIDSFVVGENCVGLKTLTHASNGRCYCPRDLGQGMSLFEIESILSTSRREKVEYPTNVVDLDAIKGKPFDTEGMKVVTVDVSNKAVMKREEILKRAKEADAQDIQQAANKTAVEGKKAIGGGGSGRERRVLKELNDAVTKNYGECRMYPTADDIGLWKILMLGPKNTPFENGIYQLTCVIPQDYPFKPPKITFSTRMHHPNISKASGGICLDILKDQWSPALTVFSALLSIRSLLTDPNPDDALDSNVAAEYKHEKELYIQNVIKEKQLYASPTVEDLLKEVLGTVSVDSQEYKDAHKDLSEWIAQYK